MRSTKIRQGVKDSPTRKSPNRRSPGRKSNEFSIDSGVRTTSQYEFGEESKGGKYESTRSWK